MFFTVSPGTMPDAHKIFTIYKASAKTLMQELLKRAIQSVWLELRKQGKG